MSSSSREERASNLRPHVRSEVEKRSLRAVAGDIGVTHPTISSFLDGQVPAERTLEKIEQWLEEPVPGGKSTGGLGGPREHRAAYGARLSAPLGDPAGSPAERLIYCFSHPETQRRFSDHPPMDFVKAAFAIALDEDFAAEELDKLGRWKEEVREVTTE